MIKVISVISKHSGNGQTTITVNLASGLLRKGYRVLIGGLEKNDKLFNWLGVKVIDSKGNNVSTPIVSSRMGIDLLIIRNESELPICLPDLEKLGYDYLLLQPASQENCRQISTLADIVVACTDLGHDDELEELQDLEKFLQTPVGKANSIDIILPNKINTKEWNQNSRRLFALADFFGFERIADPIPY